MSKQTSLNFNSDAIQTEIGFPQSVSQNQEQLEARKNDLKSNMLSVADERQARVDIDRLKNTPVSSR